MIKKFGSNITGNIWNGELSESCTHNSRSPIHKPQTKQKRNDIALQVSFYQTFTGHEKLTNIKLSIKIPFQPVH